MIQNLKSKIILTFGMSCLIASACMAQEKATIPVPRNMEKGYPRLYVTQSEKTDLKKNIEQDDWAKKVVYNLHTRIDDYVKQHVTDPTWMVSRLQMHWKTKAKNIYINGIYYSHADGEAPVPTVRLCGSRDYTTPYGKPKLEQIIPYMDDERGLYLPNKSKKGTPFEWVEQSKTGRIIYSINEEIMQMARDAAFLYWLEEDARFAKFSYDLFDTYMMGIYYREEPIDISHGHIQTLTGLTNFQVIHESILKDISELYDFLHPYIEAKYPEKLVLYDAAIKKWTDLIIKNGVPQNNWNLHQANIILKAAMVLQDNNQYKDGKGREYYINYILNVTSARQWSLTKFVDYGYDEINGVWAECPSYSSSVTTELTNFISDFHNTFDWNILPYLPVMSKAVKMLPQYLFPNGQTVGFGDSYYGPLDTRAITNMVRLAQKNKDKEQEKEFTALLRLFTDADNTTKSPKDNISSLFTEKPLLINPDYKKGNREDYITQTFYAPNVSWHVQRMGWGTHGMMVSLNASLGNHMHANGINMELYGKGLVQGADPGKGAGYLQPIYLEYYSQFPAHNTVMVDGVSSYTEMMSYHAFDLMGAYPKSEQKNGYYTDITYADVKFVEPETMSDQKRMVSIVKTGTESGYYIDIFRSRKQRGGDKFHDYFYHNLGQSMKLTDANEKPLTLKVSEDMGFAGGHLYALDYMWDKRSVCIDNDYQVEWKIDNAPNRPDVFMNLWMKGTKGREIFSIKSPPCKSFKDKKGIPYDVDAMPYLTFAARQHGEAWQHPFVAVFEPYTSEEGKSIKSITSFEDERANKNFVGLHLLHKSGREDFIFSSCDDKLALYKGMSSDATYALVGHESNGDFILFMGNGQKLSADGITILSVEKGNVIFKSESGITYLHNEIPVTLVCNKKEMKLEAGEWRKVEIN